MEIGPVLEVVVVPMLRDNYGYLIIDKLSKKAGVVDPVEPEVVAKMVKAAGVELECVLTTHNHWDHAGGNEGISKMFPDITIYGGKGDRAACVTKEVDDSSTFKIGGVDISVLFTPCHTPGHVCYVADGKDGQPKAVFTGDTLFVCGCGNFNSGTPAQMHEALNVKIAGLPDETLVYVGHEYTINNCIYALTVEPHNEALQELMQRARKARKDGTPTVPSTIAQEKATNPFMRVTEKTVRAYTGFEMPVDVIAEVRKRKSAYVIPK